MACVAPAGGTSTCDGTKCDFTCGSMKKCGSKCIATTACCTDPDCPAQAGKTGHCDTSTNKCDYSCADGYKLCGGTNCIPTDHCCTNNDCTSPLACNSAGTCACPAPNACGGCGTLAGSPSAACNSCGTYVCSTDKASVSCVGVAGKAVSCSNNAPQTCTTTGTLSTGAACSGGTPTCSGGTCTCGTGKTQMCGGAMCCAPAPANSNSSISCASGTSCLLQCNSTFHSCTGTSQPCYSDTDVAHCGPNCVNCAQPNATASCGGTQCTNTCNGYTFSQCASSGGKPVCGSWNFDSGSADNEGWSLGPPRAGKIQGATSLGIVQGPAGSKAAKVHYKDTANSEEMFLRFTTCGGGVNLTGKRLRFSIYLAGPATLFTADGYDVSVYSTSGANCGGLSSDVPTPLPVQQWTQVTTGTFDNPLFADCTLINPNAASVNAISIHLKFDQLWEGDIYFDDIQVLP